MNVLEDFRDQSPEFWAVVKLVSPMVGYSYRGKKADPSKVRRYTVGEIADALKNRDLKAEENLLEAVAAYSAARAELLESAAAPNLMNREEARELFEELRSELKPPDAVLPMNKQKGEKRHPAYLTCIVNMITWRALTEQFGSGDFDSNRGADVFTRWSTPANACTLDGRRLSWHQPADCRLGDQGVLRNHLLRQPNRRWRLRRGAGWL
jgi:hypothetical protein